ncbi:hypothetical protein MNBD_ALPHA06-864 [hydrothermal vent metagenome]|uniref:Cell division protein DivIC (FtsB), stabilizes FtsL against RasP cleavage n=1 Tax=hydrothermal vent metagenome TaxID=652676 RepID=A0A3B0RIM9_9ZZZZ
MISAIAESGAIRVNMSQFKRFLPSFGIAMMIVYFGYHALSGDQSVLKWLAYRQQEAQVQNQLDVLQDRQQVLEKQNQMLRDGSLDLDYLDERIRSKWNFAHPNDMIITMNIRDNLNFQKP